MADGIVNRSIVQAVAKGIVAYSNPFQMQEHEGHLQIGVKWAESFLKHCGYVCKEKAPKATQKLLPNLNILHLPFYRESRMKSSKMLFPKNWSSIGIRWG